ncbi:hypothetical protein V3C33_03890 [Micrococcaceae bacterium Sec5.7]
MHVDGDSSGRARMDVPERQVTGARLAQEARWPAMANTSTTNCPDHAIEGQVPGS